MMYKRLEINNLKEIQDELIQYDFFSKTPDLWSDDSPLEQLRRSGAFFYGIPQLSKLKEFLNLVVHTEHITHYHIINLIGNDQSDIHKDLDNSPWALNIPILNCETTYTIFYDDNENEIEKITLNVPYFLNIEQYHRIVNLGSNNRLAISFRFIGKELADIIK